MIKDIDINWTQLILKEINEDNHRSWTSTANPDFPEFEKNELKSLNYPFLHPTIYLEKMQELRQSYLQKFVRPGFTNTLNFCRYTKDILGHSGEFGKMAIWKLEPNEKVLPHADLLDYHSYVRRWIYNINLDSNSTDIIIDNKKIEIEPGWLFELELPLVHSFINKSKETWYFLTFDTWKN